MIAFKIVSGIRHSTCAVVRAETKHEDYYGDNINEVDQNTQMPTETMGTAFLVADGVVLTNRHVVMEIAKEHEKTANFDHWYLQFTFPNKAGRCTQTTRRVNAIFAMGLKNAGGLDVGILSFRANPNDLGPCRPVEFGNLASIRVGSDIAMCGFPLGNELLINPDLGINRAGPVVHSGIVSAVAPYETDDERSIEMFLTDMNAADGMSGSPVFMPKNGHVVGVNFAGAPGISTCAVPVDKFRVQQWIEHFRNSTDTSSGEVVEIMIKPGGDLSKA